MRHFEKEIISKQLISEIKIQCKFTLRSYKMMYQSLYNNQANHFWFDTQNFVISTANISKLLQSLKKVNDDDKNFIKNKLNLDEDSYLMSKSLRRVRNSFEHYDERIINFMKEHPSAAFVNANIGPKDMFQVNHQKFFKHYDDTTNELSFFDDVLKVDHLVDEIAQLNDFLKTNNI